MPNKPRINELSVQFTQEADSMNEGDQMLQITAQDAGGGWFYVLKTEHWASDRPSEIANLVEQVKRMVGDAEP